MMRINLIPSSLTSLSSSSSSFLTSSSSSSLLQVHLQQKGGMASLLQGGLRQKGHMQGGQLFISVYDMLCTLYIYILYITGGAPVSARAIDKAPGQGVAQEGAGAVKGAGEERNVEM